MSRNSPISADDRWFRFETKLIEYTCVDPDDMPLDLTGRSLTWVLLTRPGGTELLRKTTLSGIAIAGGDANIARVTVSTSDYEDVPAGVHHYELWDTGDDVLLASGSVVLREATSI